MRFFIFLVGIAAIAFLVSGGRLLFIPLLILPFGLFTLPRRKKRRI